jgi:hypothetical protein
MVTIANRGGRCEHYIFGQKDDHSRARRYVSNGELAGISHVVFIEPRDYGAIETVERRLEVARTVGRLNDVLADETFILMGPGRWGSQDLRLGVQVSYADICNAGALIEIERREHDATPEPSFGTHFFQDLIEASILYLPLYPEDDGVVFDEAFLRAGPNALERLLPRDAALADVIRVVALDDAAPGRRMRLVMDGEAQQALAYLVDADSLPDLPE